MSKINVLDDVFSGVEYNANRLKFYNEKKDEISSLVALMEEVDGDVRITTYSIDLSACGGPGTLCGLLERLEEMGYTNNREVPEKTENYYFTSFTDKHPDRAAVFLSFTNNKCEKIQVGTEVKEVPVYEVRCSE